MQSRIPCPRYLELGYVDTNLDFQIPESHASEKDTICLLCQRDVIVLDWLRHSVSGPGRSLRVESVDGCMW